MESMLETTLTHAADKPIEQQLVEEQARATKLGVLIAALEQLAEDGPKLSEASLAPFQVTLNQLLYQEFVHLPAAKKGAGPSMTVLGNESTFVICSYHLNICIISERHRQHPLTAPVYLHRQADHPHRHR